MFDKTTLAYPIIKQCYQDDAQKIKSQLDIITKVRSKNFLLFLVDKNFRPFEN